jgi:hypothetical protein
MEDKRGTKRPHSPSMKGRPRSPSMEGSPLSSSVSTPLPAPLGLPPPPGSPSEVSSRRHCSLMFEQGGPSERALVVDMFSDEEDNVFLDTSQDEEFIRRLFNDLNCGLLRPPSDAKVIVLSDSNEEDEVHEEIAADVDVAPSSIVRSPAPTASTANADEDPKGMQDDNSDGLAPDREIGDSSGGGDEAGSP